MNTKHTLLGIALIMPLASFAQSEVQPNEKKDTIADQEIKEVTVVSRKAGVSRLAGAINGSIINKDELFKAACCNLGESFTTRLLRLIDERGLKDSTVYKQSNISRQHFSKIQCNRDYNPKKKTVLAFAVGLHLSEDETIDLLKSAGYAFSDGSKRDWIVRYCLEQKIYNINQVNTLLFEYDQEQLGA